MLYRPRGYQTPLWEHIKLTNSDQVIKSSEYPLKLLRNASIQLSVIHTRRGRIEERGMVFTV